MGAAFSSTWTQFFPPKPSFTEANIPDLSGHVYLVTGANSGLGKELSRVLYSKNAKVYITARSEEKGNKAIEEIKSAAQGSTGDLIFLPLDLNDLASVKATAEKFLAAETKLHVLFNNAGIMGPEGVTERTAQGYEKHFGVNCLGPFLLTKLLTPLLVSTAKDEATPPNTVRVVFMTSSAAEMFADKNVGIDISNLDFHIEKPNSYRYGVSKAGDWAYAVEFSKRYKSDGLISVSLNPGNVRTGLFREQTRLYHFFTSPFMYPIINGVYTQLFAGLSPDVTVDKAGSYVIPFGRLHYFRKDLEDGAAKSEAEGGNGTTQKFWDWSEDQVKQYL
ncbi:putative estradiol 17 beta-dehydrogenase [Hypoxylon trugodes]|uniref:putative estradiol 17 beta-dehydrogenase n=1 Tax=Hypoxylon trugodes TaxID=326681 RepID=UPI0021A23347|nr:putative estradiol 17 beta-dehydrogenase [Hypoxylon trugodes]KAI1392110.1 putative estradiol 17 beta-dehydrogenase [Hypoxylon trugodes]